MPTRTGLAALGSIGSAALVACGLIAPLEGHAVDPSEGGTADSSVGLLPDGARVPVDGGPDPYPEDSPYVPPDAPSQGDAEVPIGDAEATETGPWASPNGARWAVGPGGLQITGYAEFNHPVVVASPQPSAATGNYTVLATILSPIASTPYPEFGLVARIQTDGTAVIFGSHYGGQATPFVTTFGPPSWSPVAFTGSAYSYAARTRYRMKLQVAGTQASGKIWPLSGTEPAGWSATTTLTKADGAGVGYYTYFANGAVLESLDVTVP